jgi:hypothetical protein
MVPPACFAICPASAPNSAVSAAAHRLGSGFSGQAEVKRGGASRIARTGRSYFFDTAVISSRPLQSGVSLFDPSGASKIAFISTSTRMYSAPRSFASLKMRSFMALAVQHECTIACAEMGAACAGLAISSAPSATARRKLTRTTRTTGAPSCTRGRDDP